MRHNNTNKVSPTPCHIHHIQNLDKIDTFLKPVLNIFILGNLIIEWGEGVIKEGAVILNQIYTNSWGSKIEQIKNCYYLGPSQTPKMVFFAEIVFGNKPLTFFVKSSNLNVSLVP